MRSTDRREASRIALHKEHRRIQIGRAALVGVLSGFAAVTFSLLVARAEAFSLWMGRNLPAAAVVFICSAIGGAAAWLTGRFAPEAGGSGIPHIKGVLLHIRVLHAGRLIAVKVAGGLLAFCAGFSLGREGPTVQIGAAMGKLVGDVLHVPRRSYGALIASGAGAGLAAAFNAPLAGFLFVMEELKREMSPITYGTALLGCVCSVAVTRYLLGQSPSFQLTSPDVPPLAVLVPITVLGIAMGFLGVAFNRALLAVISFRERVSCPKWLAGLTVGALSGLLVAYFPEITCGGHQLASDLLLGHFAPPHLLLLAAAIVLGKLVFTALSYGTGVPGGIFAPLLVIGAFAGYGFGITVHLIAPGLSFSAAGFATIGMAAVLSSTIRAPLTGVVMIVEMTAEYKLLYALLVGSFLSYATAELLGDEPIYEALLERDLRGSTEIQSADGAPEVIEFQVEPDSSMDGKRIKDLEVPDGTLIMNIVRRDRSMVPRGGTRLEAGDTVTAVLDGDRLLASVSLHELAKAPK